MFLALITRFCRAAYLWLYKFDPDSEVFPAHRYRKYDSPIFNRYYQSPTPTCHNHPLGLSL